MPRAITALAALSLVAALGACSSSGDRAGSGAPDPSHPHPPRHDPSGAAGLDGASFVSQVTKAADEAGTVRIAETESVLGSTITAHGAMRFGTPSAAHVMESLPGQHVEIVMVDGAVYVKGLAGGEPGKPWVRQDGTTSKQTSAMLDASDPRKTVQLLSAQSALEPAGTHDVDGITATEYDATIRLADVLKRVPQLKDSLGPAIDAGGDSATVQVWLDEHRRPVRMRTSMRLPDPQDTSRSTTSVQTVDFSHWGEPVTISAPPADQVTG